MRSPLRTPSASSAQRLFVTRTGGVGSVGVIALHMDQSGLDEKMGRKYTAIYAGARKNDFSTAPAVVGRRTRRISKERSTGSTTCSSASVARNRGMKPALVRKTEAGLYWGEKAISAGLADQVGSFDDALAAVTQAATARQTSSRNGVCRSADSRKEKRTYGSANRNETGRRPRSHRRCPPKRNPLRKLRAPAAACPSANPPPRAGQSMPPQSKPACARSTKRSRCSALSPAIPNWSRKLIAKRKTVAQVREHLLALQGRRSRSARQIQSHVEGCPDRRGGAVERRRQQLAAQPAHPVRAGVRGGHEAPPRALPAVPR